MSVAMYLQLCKDFDPGTVGDVVCTMSHEERITLRTALEAMGCQTLVMPLFYDYDRQVWV